MKRQNTEDIWITMMRNASSNEIPFAQVRLGRVGKYWLYFRGCRCGDPNTPWVTLLEWHSCHSLAAPLWPEDEHICPWAGWGRTGVKEAYLLLCQFPHRGGMSYLVGGWWSHFLHLHNANPGGVPEVRDCFLLFPLFPRAAGGRPPGQAHSEAANVPGTGAGRPSSSICRGSPSQPWSSHWLPCLGSQPALKVSSRMGKGQQQQHHQETC